MKKEISQYTSIMKNLSYCANTHARLAQVILFLITLLVSALAISLGWLSLLAGVKVPLVVLLVLSLIVPILILRFPRSGSYWLKRKFHLALYACTLVGGLMLGNWLAIGVNQVHISPQSSLTTTSLAHFASQKPKLSQASKKSQNLFTKGLFEFAGVKKVAKKVKTKVKRMQDRFRRLRRGWAFLIFMLAGFGGMILTFIMAALACGAGCSGSPAGATIFGIWTVICLLGTLFLFGYAFYRLFERSYYAPPTPPTPAPTPDNSKG